MNVPWRKNTKKSLGCVVPLRGCMFLRMCEGEREFAISSIVKARSVCSHVSSGTSLRVQVDSIYFCCSEMFCLINFRCLRKFFYNSCVLRLESTRCIACVYLILHSAMYFSSFVCSLRVHTCYTRKRVFMVWVSRLRDAYAPQAVKSDCKWKCKLEAGLPRVQFSCWFVNSTETSGKIEW